MLSVDSSVSPSDFMELDDLTAHEGVEFFSSAHCDADADAFDDTI